MNINDQEGCRTFNLNFYINFDIISSLHFKYNDSTRFSHVLLQVLIVTLRPQLKVMFTHPLKGDASTLPLLAWQFVIIQVYKPDILCMQIALWYE